MTERLNRDWTISPGEILWDWMQENGLVLGGRPMVTVLATACGRMEPERLQKILDGKARIGNVAAARLQQGTGIPASLWLKLERQFRQGLAEGKHWNGPPTRS